jgi:murein DD-endopeptidase MepM/ murein hydrolase activator NlpD
MTTAFVGAGVAALVTGTVLPKTTDPANLALVDNTANDVAERAQTSAERASRTDARSAGDTVELQAPDIFVLPLKEYTLTSKFGPRWGRLHAGIDMRADEGTPYYAVARGRVMLARYNGGYGNCIMIDHGGGIVSLYGHSSKLLVKEGQMVEAGQAIGLVGNTGYSFGSHLHLEIRLRGAGGQAARWEQTDPIPWLKSRGADIPGKTDVLTQ